MTFDTLKQYCLDKKSATVDFPFGPKVLVLKVGSKMFGLIPLDTDELWINLKSDPFVAQDLRNRYDAVKPGYHMDKRHWNTVIMDGSISDETIFEMIDESYELVFRKLKEAEQNAILENK